MSDDGQSQAALGSAWDFMPEIGDDSTPEADERYHDPVHLKTGGMGRVEVVSDRRLGRRVARKQVAPEVADHPIAKKHLVREASIAARLEHPNIVPVYDIAESEAGEPFYTMRLVRGVSMAERLRDGEPGRQLLRPFLAVCEAMAYAHEAGVVHRDLKPDNVMLGRFGEVQVVDWGLALDVDSDADSDVDSDVTLNVQEPSGAPVGTEGYMSPEQAHGGQAGFRSDVYSLGCMLAELVSGSPDGARPMDVEPALWAIVERARVEEPEGRYLSAAELAVDMARYLDGRLVGAHDYSTWQLVRRAARRYRTPIFVALGCLAIGAAALTYSWTQVLGERNRAVSAEDELRSSSLAVLGEQAREALLAGRPSSAERLARQALQLGDSMEARAVFAGLGPSASLQARRSYPQCSALHPLRSGELICLEDGAVSMWREDKQEWRAEAQASGVLDMSEDGLIGLGQAGHHQLRELATGQAAGPVGKRDIVSGLSRRVGPNAFIVGRVERAFLVHPGGSEYIQPCATAKGVAQFALAAGGFVIACVDGFHRYGAQGEELGVIAPLPPKRMERISRAAELADGRYLLGTLDGEVFALDPHSDPQSAEVGAAVRLGDTSITTLLTHPRRGLALVRNSVGETRLWEARSGQFSAYLPTRDGAPRWAWTEDALVSSLGSEVEWWSAEEGQVPARIDIGRGISGLARGREASFVADGSASIYRIDHESGAVLAKHGLDERPPMSLRLLRDGRVWVDRLRSDRAALLNPMTLEVDAWLSRWTYRDGGELASGTLWASNSWFALLFFEGAEFRSSSIDRRILSAVPFGEDQVLALGAHGGLWRLGPNEKPEQLYARPGAQRLAAVAASDALAIFYASSMEWATRTGDSTCKGESPADLSSVAMSPDGTRVALGTRSGKVWIVDDACRVLAQLVGHRDQVSALAWGPDEVLSGSWDGTVRRWSLRPLVATRDALLRELDEHHRPEP